jgi:CheY-like chemotaxis protein
MSSQRFLLAPLALLTLVLGLTGPGLLHAFQPPDLDSDYRRFFKEPQTVQEFWDAMQFEIEVGRYDLAAKHLQGLLEKQPPATAKELVELERKVGSIAILRLRLIPQWFDDAKANQEAKARVEKFIDAVSKAVEAHLADKDRIKKYVGQLSATPPEAEYALAELARSGARVIPFVLDELKQAKGSEREPYLKALTTTRKGFGPEIIPALAAALDTKDPVLKLEILDVFKARGAREVVPHLWFLAGSEAELPEVRARARALLAQFLDTAESHLPRAERALTQEAEKYYQHRVKFADPNGVVIWRWDPVNANVVQGWPGAPKVSASQAEEYYGTRFAQQALHIDPTYQPAQIVLVSLALDKAYEKHGMAQPLAVTAAQVHNLISRLDSQLVLAILERALAEHRVPVILGAVRNLGQRREVLALRPRATKEPPLVRALYYPDRRVQMAAATALVVIPEAASLHVTTRVVDVLRRALAAFPKGPAKPKVLVGYFNRDVAEQIGGVVSQAGYEPVLVATGKEALKRIQEAADIDLMLLDAKLPQPGLASLLGQLRADTYVGRTPVILTTSEEDLPRITRYIAKTPRVTAVPLGVALDQELLKEVFQDFIAEPGRPVLAEEERAEYAERAAQLLAGLAQGNPPGYDVRPAEGAILESLRAGQLSPSGQIALGAAASRLPGREPQGVLADVVVNATRPDPVREAAAAQLIQHMQRFGTQLSAARTGPLQAVFLDPKTKPGLRAQVSQVLGTLRPGSATTGTRLLFYQPMPPGAK